MQYFGEAEDVGDMERTKVIVEWVVEDGVVYTEKDCPLLRFGSL